MPEPKFATAVARAKLLVPYLSLFTSSSDNPSIGHITCKLRLRLEICATQSLLPQICLIIDFSQHASNNQYWPASSCFKLECMQNITRLMFYMYMHQFMCRYRTWYLLYMYVMTWIIGDKPIYPGDVTTMTWMIGSWKLNPTGQCCMSLMPCSHQSHYASHRVNYSCQGVWGNLA